tara:strand:- start:69 stop:272 length:204 start_codon:yes stop_codon:yes gene_type:complete
MAIIPFRKIKHITSAMKTPKGVSIPSAKKTTKIMNRQSKKGKKKKGGGREARKVKRAINKIIDFNSP